MKIEEIGSYVEYSLNKNIIDCFKHSNLNKVPQRQQISLSLSLWNDDQEDSILQKVCELVTSQLVDSLIRTISKDIFTTESISFVNFSKTYRGKPLSNQQMVSEIYFNLFHLNSKCLISNSRLCSYLNDIPRFVNTQQPRNNGLMYKIGSIDSTDLYVDPIIRWEETYMLLFDYCYIDIKNLKSDLINTSTFNPNLVVGYDLAFEVVNPKILFIFEDEYMSHFTHYLQISRDIKIDSILAK